MATDTWDLVRDAIAAKAAASAGAATAGLRSASIDPAMVGDFPRLIVDQPAFQMLDRPNGLVERYQLTVPCRLLVQRPAGRKHSNPIAAAIARALQEEWQSGIQLTLGTSGVVDSYLDRADATSPQAEGEMDGYALTFVVTVQERLTTARTV